MLVRLAGIILCLFLLASCAGIFNPYESEFSCPQTYEGKCVSIQKAYQEALDPNYKEPVKKTYLYEYNRDIVDAKSRGSSGAEGRSDARGVLSLDEGKGSSRLEKAEKEDYGYTATLYSEIKGLLKEPQTPIIMPPKAMRVLILAYPHGDTKLYMPRYIYAIVDSPKWVVVDPYMLNKIKE